MASDERDIDRLYQVPLADFVKTRAAIAREAGPRAAGIKSLQKPHVAAWGVNQLYWRRRKTYDRLTAAAERARKTLTQSLGGRARAAAPADADAAHAQAVNQAATEVRELLAEAGASTAPGTLRLVRETLLALPAQERPGRLVRPLAPLGFESLTSVLQRAGQSSRPPATVLAFEHGKTADTPKGASDSSAKAAARARERQAAFERKRELARIAAELREAQTAARRADTALAAARRTHAAAERRLGDLHAAVEAAQVDVERALAEVRRLERASKDAASARDRVEFRRGSVASEPGP